MNATQSWKYLDKAMVLESIPHIQNRFLRGREGIFHALDLCCVELVFAHILSEGFIHTEI